MQGGHEELRTAFFVRDPGPSCSAAGVQRAMLGSGSCHHKQYSRTMDHQLLFNGLGAVLFTAEESSNIANPGPAEGTGRYIQSYFQSLVFPYLSFTILDMFSLICHLRFVYKNLKFT